MAEGSGRLRLVEVGDEFTAVIVHPNEEDGRDPVAKVDGVTTFVRFPEKEQPLDLQAGDMVTARMADMEEGHNLAIALDWEARDG